MFVYRAITTQQYLDFLEGKNIVAKNPDAVDVTMASHVRKTSNKTPWISTTKTLFALFVHRKGMTHNAAIIKIDTDIAEKLGSKCYDVSTDEYQKNYESFKNWRERNWAKGEREVLFFQFIPNKACTLLINQGERTRNLRFADFNTLSEKYISEDKSFKENILYLREKINKYGEKSNKSLSRYKIKRILEIVRFLSEYQQKHTKTKWYSINM